MKIGISGKMFSGKDYISNIFIKNNPKFKRYAFADPLKEMVLQSFNVTKDHTNGRQILQLFGKTGRLAYENFWIDKLFNKIDFDNYYPIITDVRYKNEADFLKKAGFILIRVIASEEERQKRGVLKNQDDISETDLDEYYFDYYIENNTTKEELEIKLKELFGNKLETPRTKCQVYSRVCGYMSPTNQWNEGKQAEFEDRKTYNLKEV